MAKRVKLEPPKLTAPVFPVDLVNLLVLNISFAQDMLDEID